MHSTNLIRGPTRANKITIHGSSLPRQVFQRRPCRLFRTPHIRLIRRIIRRRSQLLTFLLHSCYMLNRFRNSRRQLLLTLQTMFTRKMTTSPRRRVITIGTQHNRLISRVLLPYNRRGLARQAIIRLQFMIRSSLLTITQGCTMVLHHSKLRPLNRLPPPNIGPLTLFSRLRIMGLRRHLIKRILRRPITLNRRNIMTRRNNRVTPIRLQSRNIRMTTPFIHNITSRNTIHQQCSRNKSGPRIIQRPFMLLTITFRRFTTFTQRKTRSIFTLSPINRVLPFNRRRINTITSTLPINRKRQQLTRQRMMSHISSINLTNSIITCRAISTPTRNGLHLFSVFRVRRQCFLRGRDPGVVRNRYGYGLIYSLPGHHPYKTPSIFYGSAGGTSDTLRVLGDFMSLRAGVPGFGWGGVFFV